MEHSKVWGAWPVALGSASSGLPLKMLPLKIYGSAQSVPGARIPVHSEDSGWFGDTQEPTGRS